MLSRASARHGIERSLVAVPAAARGHVLVSWYLILQIPTLELKKKIPVILLVCVSGAQGQDEVLSDAKLTG